MGPENNVEFGGCWIIECLLPYLSMVTVPHIMVGLERMLDYRGVGLARFHSTHIRTYVPLAGSAGDCQVRFHYICTTIPLLHPIYVCVPFVRVVVFSFTV